MGRETRDHRKAPNPKPVERISLSEQNKKAKFLVVIFCIVVAAVAFTVGVTKLLGKEDGWTTIETSSAAELNCGSEFIFQYELGKSGVSASAEHKLLQEAYTDACVNAYQLFSTDLYENVANVGYLNAHPNEDVQVDDALYQAFELLEAYGNRGIFLGPVYEIYGSLFFCQDDSETAAYDPNQNATLREFFDAVAKFANDESKIQLKLLGDNRVCLHVSEDYLVFATEEETNRFLDFSWMKNAFIIDYLADKLAEAGYSSGFLSSYDGFYRNLDAAGEDALLLSLSEREGSQISTVGSLVCSGGQSVVVMRDYMLYSLDDQHYYEFEDGTIRTSYLDAADATEKVACHELVCYGQTDCATMLLQMIPAFVAKDWNPENLPKALDGIYSIYFDGDDLCYNDASITLDDLNEKKKLVFFE